MSLIDEILETPDAVSIVLVKQCNLALKKTNGKPFVAYTRNNRGLMVKFGEGDTMDLAIEHLHRISKPKLKLPGF